MSDPLYAHKLRALDWRLLWWLLSKQTIVGGVATGIVPAGWRRRACKELKTYRTKIYESQKRLKEAGVIIVEPHQRNVRLNGDAFR